MNEYTPTVEEARAEFVTNKSFRMPAGWRGAEEFDRMIAEVERAAAEKAWAEGWATRASRGYAHLKVGESVPAPGHINPYWSATR